MATAELVSYQPRQLTFDFDYSEAGFPPAKADVLDGHSRNWQTTKWRVRRSNAKGYLELAAIAAEAKREFVRKPDVTWSKYCKNKLGDRPDAVNKMAAAYKVIEGIDLKVLEGIPTSTYFMISQAKKSVQNRVFKAAKDHDLTINDVKSIVQPQNGTKEIAASKVPGDHGELREAVEKRLQPLINKVADTELYEDFPVVLSEIAKDLKGGEDD